MARALHLCYDDFMHRSITQRALRNNSGAIMRALDRGETFVLTRNGVPVGELAPFSRRRFVPAAAVWTAFRGAPDIDAAQFRSDVDAMLNQTIAARE